MLNIENIKAVRDAVERETDYRYATDDKGLTMSRYKNDCGTPACIAGNAMALRYGTVNLNRFTNDEIYDQAQEWLGLDDEQADQLFMLGDLVISLHSVTKEQAVATLDKLIVTGTVVWDIPDESYDDQDDEY